MTRSKSRLFFWLVAFLILYTLLAWSVNDYAVCAGSAFVEAGQSPVINPSTCN